MDRRTLIAALTLALAACGGPPPEPPAPPPLDPTGSYDVTIDAQGTQVRGTLTIRAAGEGYSGYIDTDMGGASIADVTVDGQRVGFTVPEAGVAFEVVFEEDGFTGSFDGAMGAGSIRGVRRPDG